MLNTPNMICSLLAFTLLLGCDNLLTSVETQGSVCEEGFACPSNSTCDDSLGTATCVCEDGFQDNDDDGSCKIGCELAEEALACAPAAPCDDSSGTAMCALSQDMTPDMPAQDMSSMDMPVEDAPLDMQPLPDMPEDMSPDMPPAMDECGPSCVAPNGCSIDAQGVGTCVAAPKTCEEARIAGTLLGAGTFDDDLASLFVGNDPDKAWTARCHRADASSPYLEYLALSFGSGGPMDRSNNTSVDYASGVQTIYDAYRIDPITLIVDGSDTFFARTSALNVPTPIMPLPQASELFPFVPAAVVRGCGTGAERPGGMNTTLYRAESQFDVADTGLRVKADFVVFGVCPNPSGAEVSFNEDRTAVVLTIDPSTREPGCTGLAPVSLASKFEARCMSNITRISRNPSPADFQIQLEHAGP